VSSVSRLGAILVNGFLAPLFLMLGLHGFGLHPGYWRCFLLTLAFGTGLGAVLWGLPGYLHEKGK
jgi:hypothetical protein